MEQIDALTASIQTKLKEIGELGIEIVDMKEDVDDTANALEADKKFLAELEKGCATKTKEWEERSKIRAEELVALADTVKVLNDDDALDLFKKTLPSASASLMQTAVTSEAMRTEALSEIRSARKCQFDADCCNLRSHADRGPERDPLSAQGSWSSQASRFGFLGLGIVRQESTDPNKF